MGNQAGGYSKIPSEPSFYGGIYVKVDQDNFTPGDTLSGNCYLDLVNAYPGDKICLSVKGSEYAKWVDKEQRSRPKPDGTTEFYYVDVIREQGIDIIKQEMDVYDWQKGAIVPKGQYTFPFKFQVPHNLPGSFYFRRGNAVAEIKYSVEAFLKPERENIPKLKHKLAVTVRENPTLNIQTKEVSITKKLTTWCCLDQGTVSMRTAFEKNAYAPGEEARVITEIDNSKCSLGIPDISFSLVQSIHLTAGNHHQGFNFGIRSVNLGRIEAGQSCLGANRKEASIILPPGQEGKAKEFVEGQESFNPDPSSVITPSCHGKLVKSDFSLTVACQTEGCLCCDSAPVNSLPVTVYAPIVQKKPDPTPPMNWQPQQMPPANLTITIVNTPFGGTEIQISQGGPGMVGNQMPPQNAMQPNQNAQMNGMSSPQPQQGFQQQPQPQLQQQPQPQYQPQPQQQYQQQPQPQMQQQQYQQPQPQMQQQQYQQPQPQMQQQQYPPQQNYGQPQQIQAQPVQVGQNQYPAQQNF